jgi:hypothetical protein
MPVLPDGRSYNQSAINQSAIPVPVSFWCGCRRTGSAEWIAAFCYSASASAVSLSAAGEVVESEPDPDWLLPHHEEPVHPARVIVNAMTHKASSRFIVLSFFRYFRNTKS